MSSWKDCSLLIATYAAHRLDRYMELTMFDRLVESSRQKQGRHTGRYLLATSLLYGIGLVTCSSLAVIGFTPALAEQLFLKTKFTPPALPSGPPLRTRTIKDFTPAPIIIFRPPDRLPDLQSRIDNIEDRHPYIGVHGLPPGTGGVLKNIGATADTDLPVPPPPKPAQKIEPAPEAKHGPSKVSEGVLQGIAIKRVR